uniref:Capsid protein n=1 Tax=Cressdnavirus D_HF4_1353 TaxID=3071198 RepID=A0AA50Q9W5_9VIRU|nr:capsid protein [Cressdnavirus D_HF4_1353]
MYRYRNNFRRFKRGLNARSRTTGRFRSKAKYTRKPYTRSSLPTSSRYWKFAAGRFRLRRRPKPRRLNFGRFSSDQTLRNKITTLLSNAQFMRDMQASRITVQAADANGLKCRWFTNNYIDSTATSYPISPYSSDLLLRVFSTVTSGVSSYPNARFVIDSFRLNDVITNNNNFTMRVRSYLVKARNDIAFMASTNSIQTMLLQGWNQVSADLTDRSTDSTLNLWDNTLFLQNYQVISTRNSDIKPGENRSFNIRISKPRQISSQRMFYFPTSSTSSTNATPNFARLKGDVFWIHQAYPIQPVILSNPVSGDKIVTAISSVLTMSTRWEVRWKQIDVLESQNYRVTPPTGQSGYSAPDGTGPNNILINNETNAKEQAKNIFTT